MRSIDPIRTESIPICEVAVEGKSDEEKELRVNAIDAFYQSGATLEQVGKVFGVSRERVRQILVANGSRIRTLSETAALRRRNAASEERLTPDQRNRILEMVEEGASPEEICSAEEIERDDFWAVVRAAGVSGEIKASRIRDLRGSHVTRNYTSEELLEVLKIAADGRQRPLAASEFTAFGRSRTLDDGRPWPTHQTMANRFGSWRQALLAAGLTANPPSPYSGRVTFTREDCLDALRIVTERIGRVPSVRDYEKEAEASDGALPSSATVRNRLGSWSQGLADAGF